MTFLLDVNLLIALIDPVHIHHGPAQDWFAAEGHRSWATCPITQNGAIRIVSNPRYANTSGNAADVISILTEFVEADSHQFWPDDLSILASPIVDPQKLLTSAQITDTYLLALACSRNGQLATFDRRLSTAAVQGGDTGLFVIGAKSA